MQDETAKYPRKLKAFMRTEQFRNHARSYQNIFRLCFRWAKFSKFSPRDYHTKYLHLNGRVHCQASHSGKGAQSGILYYIIDGKRSETAATLKLDLKKIADIEMFLKDINPFVKTLMSQYELLDQEEYVDVDLEPSKDNAKDVMEEPVILVVPTKAQLHEGGELADAITLRKLQVDDKSEKPEYEYKYEKVSSLSKYYEAFSYNLLFPDGKHTWGSSDNSKDAKRAKTSTTLQEYIQLRLTRDPALRHMGLLSSEWILDMYMRWLDHRLQFEKTRQLGISVENSNPSVDDIEELYLGKKIPKQGFFIPAKEVGTAPYWESCALNSQTLAGRSGGATYLVTYTGNPDWPELKGIYSDPDIHHGASGCGKKTPKGLQEIYSGDKIHSWPKPKKVHRSTTHPDVMIRVFKRYLDKFIDYIKANDTFGKIKHIIVRIEFQNRGMPHAHILLWTDADLTDPRNVELHVCAEFPTIEHAISDLTYFCRGTPPDMSDNLHRQIVDDYLVLIQKIIKSKMIHHHSERCQKVRCRLQHKHTQLCENQFKKCCYRFPFLRRYPVTSYDSKYRVWHRRRNPVTDQSVVAHNRILCALFNCHINAEPVQQTSSMGYVLSYVHKHPNDIQLEILQSNRNSDVPRDRIQEYIDASSTGCCEACWRIRGYHFYRSTPHVEALPVQLPDKKFVIAPYGKTVKTQFNLSMIELYFCRPANDPEIVLMTYLTFYEHFRIATQKQRSLFRTDRKKLKAMRPNLELARPDAIEALMRGFVKCDPERLCRIHTVFPKQTERFMLRKLLLHKPATSFEDLRTDEKGVTHESYAECAEAIGLLANENEFEMHMDDCIKLFQSPGKLRFLYPVLIDNGANAKRLYKKFWRQMSEDLTDPENPLDDVFREGQLLRLLHSRFHAMGLNPEEHHLKPMPANVKAPSETDRLRETFTPERAKEEIQVKGYDTQANHLQAVLMQEVFDSVDKKLGRAFFWEGRSGTGKTTTAKWLLASVRAREKLAWATATTGIAAVQFECGSTGHFLWKIAIQTARNENALRNAILPGTQRHELLNALDLIIVDEISMWSGITLDTVDAIMQEVRGNSKPFGGVTMLFTGDFLQIPCVVTDAHSREDVVRHMVHNSKVWQEHVEPFALLESQRQIGDKSFYDMLQKIGEGDLPNPDTRYSVPGVNATSNVEAAHEFAHPRPGEDRELLSNHGIVVATNNMVDKHNSRMQLKNPAIERVFYSADTWINPDSTEIELTAANYDFMSKCNESGVPPHQLRLKIGDPIMLLRNIDPSSGLANGTRGILVNVSENKRLLVMRVRGTDGILRDFPIPRIDFLIHPVKQVRHVRRRQFPIRCAYCTTIHKCQSQTMDRLLIDLRTPLIPTAMGQFYVALSRTRMAKDVLLLTTTENLSGLDEAINVHSYFSEALINYVLAIENHMETWKPGCERRLTSDILQLHTDKIEFVAAQPIALLDDSMLLTSSLETESANENETIIPHEGEAISHPVRVLRDILSLLRIDEDTSNDTISKILSEDTSNAKLIAEMRDWLFSSAWLQNIHKLAVVNARLQKTANDLTFDKDKYSQPLRKGRRQRRKKCGHYVCEQFITENDIRRDVLQMCGYGDCLFEALACALAHFKHDVFADFVDHVKLRSLVCTHMEALYNNEVDWFMRVIRNCRIDFPEHVRGMRKLGTWGTRLELMATANLYLCNIKIASWDNKTMRVENISKSIKIYAPNYSVRSHFEFYIGHVNFLDVYSDQRLDHFVFLRGPAESITRLCNWQNTNERDIIVSKFLRRAQLSGGEWLRELLTIDRRPILLRLLQPDVPDEKQEHPDVPDEKQDSILTLLETDINNANESQSTNESDFDYCPLSDDSDCEIILNHNTKSDRETVPNNRSSVIMDLLDTSSPMEIDSDD